LALAVSAAPPPEVQFTGVCLERQFMGTVTVQLLAETVFQESCGFANVEDKTPLTPQTQFRVGSITKEFTAAAILLLQQDGKLAVQDPIATYIDNLPIPGRTATLHQLLTHTSGIPGSNYDTALSRRALIDLAAAEPLRFPPGSKFEHTNIGYMLLEMLIEKVSQLPYEQFVQTRLFDTAEMRDSSFDETGLSGDRFVKAQPAHPTAIWSADGFYSTAGDLLKWTTALGNGSLLTSRSAAQFIRHYPETQYRGNYFGYGVAVSHTAGPTLHLNVGAPACFYSLILNYPAQELSVVLLSNVDVDVTGKSSWYRAFEVAKFYGQFQ